MLPVFPGRRIGEPGIHTNNRDKKNAASLPRFYFLNYLRSEAEYTLHIVVATVEAKWS